MAPGTCIRCRKRVLLFSVRRRCGGQHGSISVGLCSVLLSAVPAARQNVKIATNISGGALVTLIAVFLYQAGIGHHLDKVIIGSIIPLVPGVNFTNAIRDIADQDYIAGSVRMLDALLVTFCIALGVGLIITGYHQLAGGLQL